MKSAVRRSRGWSVMIGNWAVFLLVLLSLAYPQTAQPGGMPAMAQPMPMEPTPMPPTPPELDEAIRLVSEAIRLHSATRLSEMVDMSGAELTCQECNCIYDYTSHIPLGDAVYSVNFFLNFVQSVTVMGSTVQVKGEQNTIVVTTDRKLEAMPVRDIRSYNTFEIYMEDPEAAEKVARHLMTARGLCIK